MTIDTSPWPPDVADLAASQFRVIADLDLFAGSSTVPLPVVPTRCAIDYDERRTPYARLTFTAAFPAVATRQQLDPRRGLTVQVTAGYERVPALTRDLAVMALLRAETVDTDYLARTITVEAFSDEAGVVNNPATSAYSYTAGTSILAAIQDQVAACFPGETQAWNTHSIAGQTFSTTQTLDVGDDRWDALADWAESMGAKVYHDGLGVWHLQPIARTPTAVTSAQLNGGPKGTLTGLTVRDTRDGWGNQLVMVYQPKTTAGPPTVLSAVAVTNMTPPRTIQVTRRRKPESLARSAKAALTRGLRRGHQATATATAFLWVRPRTTVTIVRPGEHQERLMVQASAFDLIAGSMTLVGQDDADQLTATVTATEQVSAAGIQGSILAGSGASVWVPPKGSAGAALSIGATQGFFSPIFIPTDRILTALAIQVATAGTRTVTIGIWAMSRDGTPGTLLLDTGPFTGALGTSGVTGLNVALPAGWYYFGVGHRGTSGTNVQIRTGANAGAAAFAAFDSRGFYQTASEWQSALVSNPPLTEQSFTDPPIFRITTTET